MGEYSQCVEVEYSRPVSDKEDDERERRESFVFEQVQLVNQGDQKYRDHNDGGERWKKSKGTSSEKPPNLILFVFSNSPIRRVVIKALRGRRKCPPRLIRLRICQTGPDG